MRMDFQIPGTSHSLQSSWAWGHKPSQQNLGIFWCSSLQALSTSVQFDGGCWRTFSGLFRDVGKGSGQSSGWVNRGLSQSSGQPNSAFSWTIRAHESVDFTFLIQHKASTHLYLTVWTVCVTWPVSRGYSIYCAGLTATRQKFKRLC